MKKTILSFLLASIISVSFSQKDDWIRIFWEPEVSNNADIIEIYDRGYIILANIYPESTVSRWGWMIKTDINGEMLWSKKIGDGSTWVSFTSILQTDDGGYLITGGTTSVVELNGDPFYMKLNACGEKEWCKVFHSETPYDFGIRTYQVPGEDTYISLVSSWGNVGPGTVMQGIWLFKMDNYGEINWMKNIFDQMHPEAWNEMPENMFLSNNDALIIYGFTLYGLPIGSYKPLIVSANPDSTENWWHIIHQNQALFGEINHAIEDNEGNIYATGWLTNSEPGASYFPAIHKLNKFGDLIYSKQFMDSTEQANAYCVNLLNDTIIDIAGVWNYEGQAFYNSIARLDTSGNFLFEKQIIQSDYSFSNTIETFDGKDLYAGPFLEGGFTKIHLYKFNSDLEYDSIYIQPFEYDYMCNELPIVSDTIGIEDCDIWTSLPGDIEFQQLQKLVVYPNPSSDKVKIRLPWATAIEQPFGHMTSRHYNLQYYENSVLRIYDVFGKQLMEITLEDQKESELEINISAFPQGIYLINLYENNKKMASGKFIKK